MISEYEYNLTPEEPNPECEYCGHNTIGEVYETYINEEQDIGKNKFTHVELCESCIREAILDGEELTTTLEL